MSAGGYTAQLARKRATMAWRLAHAGATCSIIRPTRTLDDYGKPQDSETVVSSNVPCILESGSEPVARIEQHSAGEVISLASFILLVPYDTDVKPTDEIDIDGRRLQIVSGTGDVTTQVVRQLSVIDVRVGATS